MGKSGQMGPKRERNGYSLDFVRQPPPVLEKKKTPIPRHKIAMLCLFEEIEDLSKKQAIENVPKGDIMEGFHITLFLTPKKSGVSARS
jgi:hypothetical protein